MRSEDRGSDSVCKYALLGLLALLALAVPLEAGTCPCPGDCDADCTVSAGDLAAVVSSVFDPAVCAVADADGDGRVGAADVLIVRRAQIEPPPGCGSPQSPTPTASSTATASPTLVDSPSSTPTSIPTATRTRTRTFTPTRTTIPTPASRWISLAPMPQGGRQEVGVAHLDGKIYVIGGLAPAASARVDVYDIAGDSWSEVAPLPSARHHIGAVALGGFVYSVGGLEPPGFTPTDEVLRYSPGDDEWVAVAPLPTARGALAVAVANGRIHAVAGMNDRGLGLRDHAAYIPQENRWDELADYPLAREHITAATVDGTIYVMGGRSPLETDVHRWDADTNAWIPLPPMTFPRSGHAAASYEGRLVVFGGEDLFRTPARPDGLFPEVEIYDPNTNRWTQIDDMAAPRHGIAAVTVGNRIYVPGGADVIGFGRVDTNDALEIDF